MHIYLQNSNVENTGHWHRNSQDDSIDLAFQRFGSLAGLEGKLTSNHLAIETNQRSSSE
jgi:hypothetical protein